MRGASSIDAIFRAALCEDGDELLDDEARAEMESFVLMKANPSKPFYYGGASTRCEASTMAFERGP
jgi:hypothetical protein